MKTPTTMDTLEVVRLRKPVGVPIQKSTGKPPFPPLDDDEPDDDDDDKGRIWDGLSVIVVLIVLVSSLLWLTRRWLISDHLWRHKAQEVASARFGYHQPLGSML